MMAVCPLAVCVISCCCSPASLVSVKETRSYKKKLPFHISLLKAIKCLEWHNFTFKTVSPRSLQIQFPIYGAHLSYLVSLKGCVTLSVTTFSTIIRYSHLPPRAFVPACTRVRAGVCFECRIANPVFHESLQK